MSSLLINPNHANIKAARQALVARINPSTTTSSFAILGSYDSIFRNLPIRPTLCMAPKDTIQSSMASRFTRIDVNDVNDVRPLLVAAFTRSGNEVDFVISETIMHMHINTIDEIFDAYPNSKIQVVSDSFPKHGRGVQSQLLDASKVEGVQVRFYNRFKYISNSQASYPATSTWLSNLIDYGYFRHRENVYVSYVSSAEQGAMLWQLTRHSWVLDSVIPVPLANQTAVTEYAYIDGDQGDILIRLQAYESLTAGTSVDPKVATYYTSGKTRRSVAMNVMLKMVDEYLSVRTTHYADALLLPGFSKALVVITTAVSLLPITSDINPINLIAYCLDNPKKVLLTFAAALIATPFLWKQNITNYLKVNNSILNFPDLITNYIFESNKQTFKLSRLSLLTDDLFWRNQFGVACYNFSSFLKECPSVTKEMLLNASIENSMMLGMIWNPIVGLTTHAIWKLAILFLETEGLLDALRSGQIVTGSDLLTKIAQHSFDLLLPGILIFVPFSYLPAATMIVYLILTLAHAALGNHLDKEKIKFNAFSNMETGDTNFSEEDNDVMTKAFDAVAKDKIAMKSKIEEEKKEKDNQEKEEQKLVMKGERIEEMEEEEDLDLGFLFIPSETNVEDEMSDDEAYQMPTLKGAEEVEIETVTVTENRLAPEFFKIGSVWNKVATLFGGGVKREGHINLNSKEILINRQEEKEKTENKEEEKEKKEEKKPPNTNEDPDSEDSDDDTIEVDSDTEETGSVQMKDERLEKEKEVLADGTEALEKKTPPPQQKHLKNKVKTFEAQPSYDNQPLPLTQIPFEKYFVSINGYKAKVLLIEGPPRSGKTTHESFKTIPRLHPNASPVEISETLVLDEVQRYKHEKLLELMQKVEFLICIGDFAQVPKQLKEEFIRNDWDYGKDNMEKNRDLLYQARFPIPYGRGVTYPNLKINDLANTVARALAPSYGYLLQITSHDDEQSIKVVNDFEEVDRSNLSFSINLNPNKTGSLDNEVADLTVFGSQGRSKVGDVYIHGMPGNTQYAVQKVILALTRTRAKKYIHIDTWNFIQERISREAGNPGIYKRFERFRDFVAGRSYRIPGWYKYFILNHICLEHVKFYKKEVSKIFHLTPGLCNSQYADQWLARELGVHLEYEFGNFLSPEFNKVYPPHSLLLIDMPTLSNYEMTISSIRKCNPTATILRKSRHDSEGKEVGIYVPMWIFTGNKTEGYMIDFPEYEKSVSLFDPLRVDFAKNDKESKDFHVAPNSRPGFPKELMIRNKEKMQVMLELSCAAGGEIYNFPNCGTFDLEFYKMIYTLTEPVIDLKGEEHMHWCQRCHQSFTHHHLGGSDTHFHSKIFCATCVIVEQMKKDLFPPNGRWGYAQNSLGDRFFNSMAVGKMWEKIRSSMETIKPEQDSQDVMMHFLQIIRVVYYNGQLNVETRIKKIVEEQFVNLVNLFNFLMNLNDRNAVSSDYNFWTNKRVRSKVVSSNNMITRYLGEKWKIIANENIDDVGSPEREVVVRAVVPRPDFTTHLYNVPLAGPAIRPKRDSRNRGIRGINMIQLENENGTRPYYHPLAYAQCDLSSIAALEKRLFAPRLGNNQNFVNWLTSIPPLFWFQEFEEIFIYPQERTTCDEFLHGYPSNRKRDLENTLLKGLDPNMTSEVMAKTDEQLLNPTPLKSNGKQNRPVCNFSKHSLMMLGALENTLGKAWRRILNKNTIVFLTSGAYNHEISWFFRVLERILGGDVSGMDSSYTYDMMEYLINLVLMPLDPSIRSFWLRELRKVHSMLLMNMGWNWKKLFRVINDSRLPSGFNFTLLLNSLFSALIMLLVYYFCRKPPGFKAAVQGDDHSCAALQGVETTYRRIVRALGLKVTASVTSLRDMEYCSLVYYPTKVYTTVIRMQEAGQSFVVPTTLDFILDAEPIRAIKRFVYSADCNVPFNLYVRQFLLSNHQSRNIPVFRKIFEMLMNEYGMDTEVASWYYRKYKNPEFKHSNVVHWEPDFEYEEDDYYLEKMLSQVDLAENVYLFDFLREKPMDLGPRMTIEEEDKVREEIKINRKKYQRKFIKPDETEIMRRKKMVYDAKQFIDSMIF